MAVGACSKWRTQTMLLYDWLAFVVGVLSSCALTRPWTDTQFQRPHNAVRRHRLSTGRTSSCANHGSCSAQRSVAVLVVVRASVNVCRSLGVQCRSRGPIAYLWTDQQASWRSCQEGVSFGVSEDRMGIWVDKGGCCARIRPCFGYWSERVCQQAAAARSVSHTAPRPTSAMLNASRLTVVASNATWKVLLHSCMACGEATLSSSQANWSSMLW